MLNPNNTLDRALLSVVIILCLIAVVLFTLVPADSLDTGLVYRGF